MRAIEWVNFDGSYFQRFCNALLFFEVSKFAHVFTAAGKDDGVDQLFSGNYNGKNGLWRFQDKFHNSSKRADDIAALKRDIIADLDENYNGENFIVFISNVNLNPPKYQEFLQIAKQLIEDKGIRNCEFILWHEANIETLLTAHPIVYQQFWDRDSILLQTYNDYFAHQLDSQSTDTRYQLKNLFFGRVDSIKALTTFLHNDNASTIAIISNGGYGKTRLAIEFFKTVVDANDEWIPLVLSHMGFNANRFAQLLQTSKRILLLIDNGHEVPGIVSEVKRLVDNSKGKDKLILTTRMTLFSDIIEKIPTHSRQIEHLLLKNLQYEETKQMIRAELPGLKDGNLFQLAEVSKGVPNLILEFVRLIINGKQPYEITNESDFADSVQEIFSQAVKDISRETSIASEKIKDLIKLISIISPVANDDTGKAFIGEVIDLRKDKLELVITSLAKLGLLEYKHVISIKPDPYSDAILHDTIQKNKAFVEHIKDYKGAENYLENILKNLAEAEIEDKEKEYFIDGLVTGYVRLISDPTTDALRTKSIYELVEKIGLKKIPLAIYAVKEFIAIYGNKEHPIHFASEGWGSKNMIGQVADSAYKILTNLATYSSYGLDNKEEIFILARAFAAAVGKFNILQGCFGYHEWDFPYYGYSPRACIERQLFLNSKICVLLEESSSSIDLEMALFVANFLLELDFHIRETFEPATMQFTHGIAVVPDCPHVLAMRSDLIKSLIVFYNSELALPKLKLLVLKELLVAFWYASNGYKNRYKQDFSADIKVIFTFFEHMLRNKPSVAQKSLIISTVNRYRLAGYDEKYKRHVETLMTLASEVDSLYDQLQLHILNDDYFDTRKHLEGKIDSIIARYATMQAFFDDLITIRTHAEQSTNFAQVLVIIAKLYPEDAKSLFAIIQAEYPQLISDGLLLVRNQYIDKEYFKTIISWLWERKETYIQNLIWLLTWGRHTDREYFAKSELEYFEYVVENIKTNCYDSMAFHFLNYAYVDKPGTFAILEKYLKVATSTNIETFIISSFDLEHTYGVDFRLELKKLFDDNPEIFQFGGVATNMLYSFVDLQFGFDTLIVFITNKLSHDLKDNRYMSFNENNQLYVNPNVSEEESISRFIILLKKYISAEKDELKIGKIMLGFFRPAPILFKNLDFKLCPVIESNEHSKDNLVRIAEGLQVLSTWTEDWINTISFIANLITKLDSDFQKFEDVFGYTFFNNLGSKSKSGRGIPYDQDVFRKLLLEKLVAQNKFPSVTPFLQQCLNKVVEDIEETISLDNESINW